jgi:hypothetical protein
LFLMLQVMLQQRQRQATTIPPTPQLQQHQPGPLPASQLTRASLKRSCCLALAATAR